jgi:hypothetical protein
MTEALHISVQNYQHACQDLWNHGLGPFMDT